MLQMTGQKLLLPGSSTLFGQIYEILPNLLRVHDLTCWQTFNTLTYPLACNYLQVRSDFIYSSFRTDVNPGKITHYTITKTENAIVFNSHFGKHDTKKEGATPSHTLLQHWLCQLRRHKCFLLLAGWMASNGQTIFLATTLGEEIRSLDADLK